MNRLILLVLIGIPCWLSAPNDLNAYRDRGSYYLDVMMPDSALHQFRVGLAFAKQINNREAEGYFLSDIGYVYLLRNDLKNATEFFENARVTGEAINDNDILANSYLNLGIINNQRGLYAQATEMLFTAIRFYEISGEKEAVASAYNTLGNVKQDQGELKNALRYYHQSLAMRKQLLEDSDSTNRISLQTDIASSLNNIGETHVKQGDYQTATYFLNAALSIKRTLADTLLQASTLAALGETSLLQNRKRTALQFFYQAYRLRKKYNDLAGTAHSANLLAGFSLEEKKYAEAEMYIREAINAAATDSIYDELLKSYDLARHLYRATGAAQPALLYDDLFIGMNKLVFDVKKRRIQEDMEAKYQSDKKEAKHKLERQTAELKFWTLACILLGVLILAGIASWAYYRKKRDQEKMEGLWKELNHRVKNNLQTLSSLIGLQRMQLKDPNAQKTLLDMESRVRAMGVMHRKLYMSDDVTLIGIHVLVKDLVDDLMTAYGFLHLKVHAALEEVDMPADKAIPLGHIVNEVLTNAFKYAFPGQAEPELTVQLRTTGKTISLLIRDNGPGIPEEQAVSDSFGFKLIRLFIKQLNGSVTIHNNQGTWIEITLNA